MLTNIIFGIFGIFGFLIINNKLKRIIMQNDELAQGLTDLSSKVDDISAAEDALVAAIKTNPQAVPQNVVDAFTTLQGHLAQLGVKVANLTTAPVTTGDGSDGSAPADNGSAPADTTNV